MLILTYGCSNDIAANVYTCVRDADCVTNFYCDLNRGVCLPEDNRPDAGGAGDCRQANFACATGFSCQEAEGQWVCLPGSISDPDAFVAPPANCTDGVQNGSESDVDCGGDCSPCITDQMCGLGSDCQSQVCAANLCQAPSCMDGIQNGEDSP